MSAETAPPERPWRWVIIALIFLGTVINYFDRLALPTLAPVLRAEFKLTNVDYAWIANSFLLVYALSMFLWGAVFDRIGNRLGFGLAVVMWSVAQIGTAAARGVASLCVLRGLLGLGEAGNWPGATRRWSRPTSCSIQWRISRGWRSCSRPKVLSRSWPAARRSPTWPSPGSPPSRTRRSGRAATG